MLSVTDPGRIRDFDESAPGPEDTETATFALGCFWGPDSTFGAVSGVVRTRVGYAGGEMVDPTYHDLGGHSEAIQVEFDPDVLDFEAIADLAIDNHDPRNQPRNRQYQYVCFYEGPDQRSVVEDRLDALAIDDPATRVESLEAFHLAEPYHQKYSLRNKRAIWTAFEDAGYDEAAIRESPAAAKLNAQVTGKSVPAIEGGL